MKESPSRGIMGVPALSQRMDTEGHSNTQEVLIYSFVCMYLLLSIDLIKWTTYLGSGICSSLITLLMLMLQLKERGIERPVTKHGISQYDHRIIRQTRFQMTIGWLLNVCRT